MKPVVREVNAERAVPFMRDYAARYDVPFNDDALDGVAWVGAFERDGLHAVAGIRDVRGAIPVRCSFPTWRYIYGVYGDAPRYVYAVARALVDLPFGLVGVICTKNAAMARIASRHGFNIERADERFTYITRAPKLDVLRALHNGQRAWA
jgi:hypothetical protein